MVRSDPGRVRVGLALAGGGGRGLAHVGVLKVLEAEDVPLDLIAGTSIGAIVGAMYACEPDAALLEERILEFIESRAMKRLGLGTMERLRGLGKPGEEFRGRRRGPDSSRDSPEADGSGEPDDSGRPDDSGEPDGLFARWQRKFRQLYASHRAMTRIAMLPGDAMTEALDGLYRGCAFEDLKLPFAAVAVDIHAGQEVIITQGSLAEAVAASAALAGIFPPVELDGRTLIDGGYVSPVPVEVARTLGANVVVAVDVSMTGRESGTFPNAVEVAMRAGEISRAALEREQLRHADVVIPARFAERHWSDFSVAQDAIAGGEKAARNLLDSIRSAIDERSRLFI